MKGEDEPSEPVTAQWDGPGLDAWQPWHPAEVAERLSGLDVPWCVVGGWAIELFLGRPHRVHEDIEIAIPRHDIATVRERLTGFALHTAGGGEVRALAAGQEPPRERHQTWVLDTTANAWRMDLMLEPGDADTWVFRRDERISAPRTQMTGWRDAIPYLRPEGVLLYKARLCRDKDELDFATCLPLMEASARAWLAERLRRVHPDHDWIARLQNDPAGV